MNGKRLRVNDFKLTYGQETIYINMYAAFKNKKNGNKYAIYSYENKNKLNYGTFHQRDKEAVIMTSKENPSDIIKEYTESLLEGNKNDKYETILLKEIETVQIIDEYTNEKVTDLNQLKDLTIPKEIKKEETKKKKKSISIATTFFALFILVVIAFFFVNPEVIVGKDKYYTCKKSYLHKTLPASVTEEITLTFSGQKKIKSIKLTKDYIFNNTSYYQKFKEKNYYYQYMEEGDTYKLIDEKYTYRLFSSIDTKNEEYFLPVEEQELISYYENENYTCRRVEVNE